MRGDQRTQLELYVLVRRKFIFEFCFAGPIAPIAFAHSRDGLQGEFLLAFKTDARPFSEAENIFRFDVAIKSRVVLGARAKTGSHNQWRGKKERTRRAGVKHIPFPHWPGSRSGNQAARLMTRAIEKQFKKIRTQVNARGAH